MAESSLAKFKRFVWLFSDHYHACPQVDLDFTSVPLDDGIITSWFCHHCALTMDVRFTFEDWRLIRKVAADWDRVDQLLHDVQQPVVH